jgi:hypothetical protein
VNTNRRGTEMAADWVAKITATKPSLLAPGKYASHLRMFVWCLFILEHIIEKRTTNKGAARLDADTTGPPQHGEQATPNGARANSTVAPVGGDVQAGSANECRSTTTWMATYVPSSSENENRNANGLQGEEGEVRQKEG